jgi:putative heme-binding domain-containing protein
MLSRTFGGMIGALLLCSAVIAQSQREQSTNPLGGNERAIAEGRELYSRTCTVCHGLNGAAGERAPALGGGRSYVVRTDTEIFDAIKNGIAGSTMPAFGLQTMEIWRIVAYIRSLRATASEALVAGNLVQGERVFWDKGGCGVCHMIRGRGGISGPDLSNLGGERTVAAIRDSLTRPKPQVPRGYQQVEVTTVDGRTLAGIAKNDNNFSLQLLDSQDRLHLLTSDEWTKITYKPESLMPTNYGKMLTASELQDLLAFLSRQFLYKVERRRRTQEDE